jgi:membrane-associated protease RseP (regulator of RpoE activity)
MVLNIARAACVSALALLWTVSAGGQGRSGLAMTGQSRPLLYGFALECVDCQPGEGARGRGGNSAPGWTYTSFPRVVELAPGSAAEKAGIKPGDLLLSVDGMSMTTPTGAQRFANGTAGTVVRLVFERSAKAFEVPLLLGAPLSNGGAAGQPTKIING